MAATTTNDWIVASFAVWAGDWCYLEKFINNDSLDDRHEGGQDDYDNLLSRMNKNQLDRYKKKRDIFLKSKGLKKYPILKTDHLRATVWQVSDFEYCMRGYIADLSREKEIFKTIHQFSNRESDHQNKIDLPNLSTVWSLDKNGNCITRIDEMGLIECTCFVCVGDPKTRQRYAKERFEEIMSRFNDGAPEFVFQELINQELST